MVSANHGDSPTSHEKEPPLVAWFCLRTQPKHEHIAAANLRRLELIEVFSPRIRFRRATRRGPVWFTEALFPGYVFARFDWTQHLRLVHHASGVTGVVHFGDRYPTIPDLTISTLRESVGEEELKVVEALPEPGDPVLVSGGAFHGLEGTVVRILPSRQRVGILLEFLGRQTMVDVGLDSIVRLPNEEARVRQRSQKS